MTWIDYVPERGYWTGPTLPRGERPWPTGWEQTDPDACLHSWELVTVTDGAYGQPEPVVRCRDCHVPRCGPSDDRDPCMERRHHDGLHIHLSGWYEPLSGLMPAEDGS